MKLNKLHKITYDHARIEGHLSRTLPILEGYGRTLNFKYTNYKVDPRPHVLVLGRYRNPNTGNILVGGINLHYLNARQVESVRRVLPKILTRAGLKDRYWAGRKLLPEIFEDYYRTYNDNYIVSVTPDTLRFWNPEGDEKRLVKQAKLAQREKERVPPPVSEKVPRSRVVEPKVPPKEKPEITTREAPTLKKPSDRIQPLKPGEKREKKIKELEDVLSEPEKLGIEDEA